MIRRNLHTAKSWSCLALLIGFCVGLSGLVLISGYILEAVVKRWGNADQSLLFWYLPFLLFGVILTGGGIGLLVWAVSQLKGEN